MSRPWSFRTLQSQCNFATLFTFIISLFSTVRSTFILKALKARVPKSRSDLNSMATPAKSQMMKNMIQRKIAKVQFLKKKLTKGRQKKWIR